MDGTWKVMRDRYFLSITSYYRVHPISVLLVYDLSRHPLGTGL